MPQIVKLKSHCCFQGDEGVPRRDVCVGTSVATITDPDCLGPCEPGTSVMLEGIVWHETEGGVLVVNVTWRGKTYVGTLLDCTRHDWAPPRFCDSPTSDIESRTPKGRGKRGRTSTGTPTAPNTTTTTTTATTTATVESVTETRSGKLRNATAPKGRRGNLTPTFNPPPSPVKSEPGGTKRKGREAETNDVKNCKRSRGSRGTPTNGTTSPGPEQPSSPQLIECPEPNCNKKYKHINGLKYHQSHAHNSVTNDDETSTEGRAESEVEESRPPSPTPVAEAPVDKSDQDLVKPSVLRYTGPPKTPSPGPVLGPGPSPVSGPGPGPGPIPGSVPVDDIEKGPPQLVQQPPPPPSASQPSVIQTLVPQATPAVYMYAGSGGVVSPQHPQVSSPALGVSPVPGAIPQVRPGQIRPEVRPDVMMRVNPVAPRPTLGQIPPVVPGSPAMPVPPQGTPLSSLPGNSPSLIKVKQTIMESEKGKSKELVNGIVNKDPRDEEQLRREDARSPAYSDISDNEPASVLDGENDNKDLPDDKKPELPLGAQPYQYLYYPPTYGQPSPFLMPPLQPPPPPATTPGKEGDTKDSKDKCDKDKSIPPPGTSEYLSKIPPQYIYAHPYLYSPAYDPYLREAPIYKPEDSKDLPPGMREGDKGPTDLSRSAPGIISGMAISPLLPKDKVGVAKDKQAENHAIIKEAIELKGQLPSEKRPYEPAIPYRYPFDQRLPLQTLPPQEKPGDKAAGLPKPSPPTSLSSPRVESTTPLGSVNNKDDRGDKKPEIKNEGVKPTMETTGPPPPPTSSAYYPPFPYGLPYDPYRQNLVHSMPMAPGFPHYLAAAPGIVPRFPLSAPVNNAPEDLSRGGSSGAMLHPSHHLYSNHKIHELQERALKSPLSPALGMTSPVMSTPQKIGSPLANKEGSIASAATSSSSSSLAHSGSVAMGGGVEGRSPPTARPPTHHLHESYSSYSLLPQYPYAALGAGQTAVPAAAPSGLAPAPPAK
ncbi:hypothetical protein SK128_007425 [Halocaridina rubra]|uniref:C2H2-type domain-containing protein n=1 Tax=Halocaridina rubra TaxID=373956 RepID=A0AAN9ADN6_HALRR